MLWLPWYTVYLVEGLVVALAVGFLALLAPRLVSGEPRSLWALRTSMLGSAIATLLVSVGILYLVFYYLGTSISLGFVVVAVTIFLVLQWLLSPYIINSIYGVRPISRRYEWLKTEVKKLAEASGLKSTPKLVIVDTKMPNAFAYGSPLTGNYIAVTKGLLELLPPEEVKAVIGHELGHLKHRDVPMILALSLLPTAIYFLGRTLVYWSLWGGFSGRSRREGENSTLVYIALGAVLLVTGFLLHFVVTHFNRLREYYADANSALVTRNPKLLQRALARLHLAYTSNDKLRSELESRKTVAMLFIVNYLIDLYGSRFYNPYTSLPGYIRDIDEIVERLKHEKTNSIIEVLSTHPPIPKRLRFLDKLLIRYQELLSMG